MVLAPRRKAKGTARILYWFRTPPGIRVGRGPLDAEAIRLIEASNPNVDFDWTRILQGPAAIERRDQPKDRERNRPVETVSKPVARPDAAPAESESPAPDVRVDEPATAVHARLGSEGLARLRGRHAEMIARIDERRSEPEKRTELKALAERLNPDAWVTDADVSAALESYESTFAMLRAELGGRQPPR